MTKDEFLQRFQMTTLEMSSNQQRLLKRPTKLTQSAVLIALLEENNQLQVLLTKRAEHLKHHPGQISFPGGKVEPEDESHIDAALREADEEIGLSRLDCKVIGQLHPYQTISGFSITPVIAILNTTPKFSIDKNEVSEIFHVPFQHFLELDNHYSVDVQHKTLNQKVHFMPYKSHNIWGATAAILNDLSTHILNTSI